MFPASVRADPRRFVNYYESQVGGSLPGFYGAPVMYGRGIGSIFSRLFRFVSPLVKKGFNIAKPHLKSAATNIASDVIKSSVGSLINNPHRSQEGSGGIAVLSRRPRKRPPGDRISTKGRGRKKRKSVGRSGSKGRKSTRSADIF